MNSKTIADNGRGIIRGHHTGEMGKIEAYRNVQVLMIFLTTLR